MAKNAMAAMLDELMGPKRNLDIGKDTRVSYDDPEICKFHIVAFCPHEMFTNTKADLGPCPKVHDENLRLSYPTSPEFEKLGFEREFLRYITRLEEDNQRRIKKNKDKLRANDEHGYKKEEERKQKNTEELAKIDEEIKQLMQKAEEAGNRGEVALSHELVEEVEFKEKTRSIILERIAAPPPVEINDDGIKPKDVCEVCGSILIRNDAQCRVEEHLSGKMHMGFQKIQVTIKELQEKLKQMDEEAAKEKSRDRRRSGSRDRRRSRSPRDKARDNRGRRERSRSRDRRHSNDRYRRDDRGDRRRR